MASERVVLIVTLDGITLFRTEPLEPKEADEAIAGLGLVLGRHGVTFANEDAYRFNIHREVWRYIGTVPPW